MIFLSQSYISGFKAFGPLVAEKIFEGYLVLVLLFDACGLFFEAICLSCLVLFCSCVFLVLLGFAITALGEERANLSAFCTFVRFALVWFCLFPFPQCLGRAATCDCGNFSTFFLPYSIH